MATDTLAWSGRCKKAVDFSEEVLAAAEGLKAELEATKKERETAERLERERVEREAAGEELTDAIEKCKERSRGTRGQTGDRARERADHCGSEGRSLAVWSLPCSDGRWLARWCLPVATRRMS